METRQNEVISYIAHEGEMARMERVNNRLWVVIIILIIALLGTNGAWLWYESQWEVYEEVTQEVTQDADGGGSNKFVGGDYYGETNGENHN